MKDKLISREEFHRRYAWFKKVQVLTGSMDTDILFDEIVADAPFRNHTYMFSSNHEDFKNMELQEPTVGIKNKFPDIKTEAERFAKIESELMSNTYEPIPVSMDIDDKNLFYIEDGFHRIFLAKKLGIKELNVELRLGKFMLSETITFGQLVKLLNMVQDLFGTEYPTIGGLRDFLKLAQDKKEELKTRWMISYEYPKVDDKDSEEMRL